MNEDRLLNYLTESNLESFQNELYEFEDEILNENNLNDINYKNTILHNLILTSNIKLNLKLKAIYILCDIGININSQNQNHQTSLHLAIINYLNQQDNQEEPSSNIYDSESQELYEIVNVLLINGCDLTIVDKHGLCSYNYLKRIKNKILFEKLCRLLKIYYPTYWIAIDNLDMNLIRRLINSWCKFFNIKKRIENKYITIVEYARKNEFQSAIDLFEKLNLQMNLCFSVFAVNKNKIEKILLKEEEKSSSTKNCLINFNFKNMIDSNATLKYYILRENNIDLVNFIRKVLPRFDKELTRVSDHMLDYNRSNDIPVLFCLLKNNLSLDLLKLIVKPFDEFFYYYIDHTQLRYKGETLLFYALDIDLELRSLEYLLNYKHCQFELFTLRDCENLSIFDKAKLLNKNAYVELLNKILVEYVLYSKRLRLQLAYNGFDFDAFIADNEKRFFNYDDNELNKFLSKVKKYQDQINKFHEAVELDNYDDVCDYYYFNDEEDDDLFITNLIDSKISSHNQTVMHRAVFNQNIKILEFLLKNRQSTFKMDLIRDHCYRTPLHYAYGMKNNKEIVSLLLDYGFSENVFDKDGMSPLDFYERQESVEVQELILLHKNQEFSLPEPNPWSFTVWTRLQQEKDTSKQIALFNSKIIHQHHSHNHHHGHSHGYNYHHPCNKTYTYAEGSDDELEKDKSCILV